MGVSMRRQNPKPFAPVREKALEGRAVSAKPRVIT